MHQLRSMWRKAIKRIAPVPAQAHAAGSGTGAAESANASGAANPDALSSAAEPVPPAASAVLKLADRTNVSRAGIENARVFQAFSPNAEACDLALIKMVFPDSSWCRRGCRRLFGPALGRRIVAPSPAVTLEVSAGAAFAS